MKKQFLILFVALMAFGINKAFAQPPNLINAPTTLAPTPIDATCIQSGPLNPVAGTEYTYTVDVPTPAGVGKQFHWFVTTNPNFIVDGVFTTAQEPGDGTGPHIADSGPTYHPTINTGTAPAETSVEITWKSFTHDPSAPVFLVIYVKDDECLNDNLEVFVIKPVHSFTLDIANLAVDGSQPDPNDDYEVCVAPVFSAIYDISAERVLFDYGTNYLFFIVSAANFSHSWLPSFQVDGAGLVNSRVITAVDWAYPADAEAGTWVTSMTGGGAAGSIWTGATPVVAQDATGTVGTGGESIVVRLTIANNQQETIADAPITLAVDGVMYDVTATNYSNTALGDIHHEAGAAAGEECPWIDGFENDIATQILTARPDIIENVPAAPAFEDTNRD